LTVRTPKPVRLPLAQAVALLAAVATNFMLGQKKF